MSGQFYKLMVTVQEWIPFAAALGGAFIGAVLRPPVEHWFASRRKDVMIVHALSDDGVSSKDQKGVSLSLHGAQVENLFWSGFSIDNVSGKTLRDVTIKIFRPLKSSDKYRFVVNFRSKNNVEFLSSVKELGLYCELKIENMPPRTSIFGEVMASERGEVQSLSGEIEIGTRSFERQFRVGTILLFVMSVMIIGSLVVRLFTHGG